jgi:type VI secretion system VgrG family protein
MTSLDKNLNAGNKRFSFASKAYGADKFSVVKMEGFEAISANFSFELVLVSDDASVDFDKMLSNPATFTLYAAGGNMATPYHGVLSEFEQLHQAGDLVFYRAVLAPRLQRLNLYRTSDVHLNDQTIPEILEAVIKDSGLTSADYEKKIKGSYRKRSFVCQYQETNLDFIMRWMEKEGMYFYFDHSGNAEKLVMVDDTALQPAGVLGVTYRPVENMASGAAKDSVQNFVCRQKPLPKQVILQGFDYEHAAVELKQTAPVSDSGAGDVMLYGENFLSEKEGERYAKLRAQEILCGGKVFKGEATAVGLRSGYFMRMAAHYRPDFNGQYLVTQVEHYGSQAGVLLAGIETSYGGKPGETDYHLKFEAIPSAVQFRPARSMIRPHVAGTVSAIVDAGGGAGDYADMDEQGRYTVQLPFSRTGKAANKGSARIRMATPYSGSDHGMNFPLHKGAEVLLSFVDGDPDQPVIVNAVPNSENLSVVNSNNRTKDIIKSAGGGFMEFEDTKTRQHLHLYSPSMKTSVRMGAATDPQSPYNVATHEPWEAGYGVLCETEGNMGLNPLGSMVLKAGTESKFPGTVTSAGEMQILAKKVLMDLDNARPSTAAATTTGSLDIYAKHINMYAEPVLKADGSLERFKYQLLTASTKDADMGSPWGFPELYKLQSFNEDTKLTKLQESNGTKVVSASDKTTYTKGNSNAATFGDSASVVHGNTYKLSRGMDFSHTYGMSNSVYFGMKNDSFVGATSSLTASVKMAVSGGLDTSFFLGAKVGFAIGPDIKANGSANIRTELVKIKNSTAQVVNNAGAAIRNAAVSLENQVTRIGNAALHMFN